MPCTNVAKKKELTSNKQIAGQKSKQIHLFFPATVCHLAHRFDEECSK